MSNFYSTLLHYSSYSPLCGGKYRYVEFAVIAYVFGADDHNIDGNSTIVCSTNEIFIFLQAPLKWQGIVIVVMIVALSIAIATTVIYKRKQSLRSLHHDLAAVANDNHPIYEEVSLIEILRWYAEVVQLADEGAHQYDTPKIIPPL